jgi:outer membrane biosynthesis protein TonB
MDERERQSKRLVQPTYLRRKLEEGASSGPSIPFPDPHRSRAGRLASRLAVLLQIVVLVGAVVIPVAAIAANPHASSDPAVPEATATPEPTPEPTPDPTPEPTPDPTPAPTPDPTPEPTVAPDPTPAPDPTTAPEPTPAPDPTTAPEPTPDPGTPAEPEPSATPTEEPSATPTATPEATPEATPSATPELTPTYVPSGPPTIASDLADYRPGATVTLTGENWAAAEVVHIRVNDTWGSSWSRDVDVTASSAGRIVDAFQLPNWFVSDYDVTATGPISGVAVTSFTDAAPPSNENLWQCDPPASFDPATYDCATASNTGWVTGNNDGPYREGDTVPYRTRFQNLAPGTEYSVLIEWDTTKQSKHAIDYIKSFDATITGAEPCASLSGLPSGLCSGTADTFPIPPDPFMNAHADFGGVQDPGVFTMFGGDIVGVSSHTTPSNYTGDTSTSIRVFFTAGSTDAVLAWGGHIASRLDWGPDSSAVSISGSPYHMRLNDFDDEDKPEDFSVGNTDRSLSADAVILPSSITIIKAASPEGSTSFTFTASPAPLSNFSLVDDGTSSNTKVFSGITNFTTYTVAEGAAPGWTLSFSSPVCTVTGASGGSRSGDVGTRTVTITLVEDQNVTCTFVNTRDTGSIELRKDWIGTPSSVDLKIGTSAGGNEVDQALGLTADGSTGANTVDTGTYFVSEVLTNPTDYATSLACFNDNGAGGGTANDGIQNGTEPAVSVGASDSVAVTQGADVVCTYTNTRLGSITIIKDVNPEPDTTDFSFTTSATLGVTGDSFSLDDDGVNTGTGGDILNSRLFDHLAPNTVYTVTEDGETSYDLTALNCTGLDANDSSSVLTGVVSVNLDPGQTVECTYTNSKLPTIIVRKITTGTAGGPFAFETTGGNGLDATFDLTTVTPGVAVQQSFEIGIIGGDFSVTESLPLPAGFVFTDVGCEVTTAGAGGTGVISDDATRTGTINDLAAGATVTCTFTNSGAFTTRTQGFWATHFELAVAAWFGGTEGGHTFDGVAAVAGIGDTLICGRAIDDDAKLMGAFWASISKKSDGTKRSPIDQARMRLLQQLIAAELNASAFGSSPSVGSFAAWETALCGDDLNAIKTAASQAAAFNEAGDSGLFTPGMSADPKASKAAATANDRAGIKFWDILPAG